MGLTKENLSLAMRVVLKEGRGFLDLPEGKKGLLGLLKQGNAFSKAYAIE